jgi:DNA-binding transcriptional MerR regulator
MKPSEIATFLGLGRSTVALWTSGEYREFFTPSAQGGQGRARSFTDRDIRVMYALKEMKANNTPAESIHETLRRWRADDWHALPDLPAAPANFASVPVVPTAAADAALSAERRALLREIGFLQQRIEQLEAERQTDRAALEALLREIADLTGQLQRALTLNELHEQGRIKPKE